ncbi:helicase domain-containing protein [Gluconacetobacter johannae DSM 13595]|uniref:Helicase n=1 Tax=Gluconacetobacter johannae TaxID=112140 RepID=A0A7W4P5U6_9PROT|nr:DISARM system helicase DrmA [Gluconacetobacter johannae]MBB2176548.1 helicase [Gluconacetobacter johannae]GBQ80085.1 helicase domain-containing protein [Gluconacetobacter johannae DSM 13595]
MIVDPDLKSWLAQEPIWLGSGIIQLDGKRSTYSAVDKGHWIVAVDADGTLTQVGRVLRIRGDLYNTTIYFDRVHTFRTSGTVSGLGLTLPTGPIARLRPEDLTSILALDGISIGDVPLIQDVAYVRDLLEIAVRDDLLGPAGGPHELIKDMSVRDRYLVGKLAPRRPSDTDAVTVEPAAGADEIRDIEDERVAPIHEPGAEFANVSGRVELEDDALDEIDTTNNQSLVPSSMGLTFCVAPGVEALAANVRWGRYERVPSNEHDFVKTRRNRATGREEETKVRVWRRIPCGGVVPLPLKDGVIRPATPDRDQPEVRLQGTIRTNAQGERLVTLFLVNGQLEPDDNKDRAWLFQPEISVAAAEGAADPSIFRRRPSNEIVVDDPERDRLALIYRNRLEFAVGHGVSVHADTTPGDSAKASHLRTEIIPRYEVAVTETPGLDPDDRPAMRRMVDEGWLDMGHLAEMEPQQLREALSCLVDDYAVWIAERRMRLTTEITGFDEPGKDVIIRCEETLRRLREGMDTLFSDDAALSAFRFANKSMALQRVRSLYALKRRRGEPVEIAQLDISKNRSWRPFQLAFLLLSVPSLADPTHSDRTKPAEAFADLLWFPTGGGKTEAYLGVAAFAMAMRRLKDDLGGLDASRGLAVIMRYTLRLLTLQQFQRAATLLCAMEVIRVADKKLWGKEPFSLGLWVGNRVTPGRIEEAHQAIEALRNGDRNKSGIASPAQLTNCPWCGSEISAGRDIEVDRIADRTLIYCSDKFGSCEFSRASSSGRPHQGLPVKVVDEEIYHRPPTMMIATVDKFAMMAWRPEVRTLFGRVDEECERHGLLWPGHDCRTGHRAQGSHPAARVKPVRAAIRPPDLIIQDEFHLISGPLGTMVGLYESAVDELSSWFLGDKKVRPKVVASTATVRRAEDQVRNVFVRRISVFPPTGLDVEDNFFSVQRSIGEKPGRRYMGICAPGSSRPAVLIRTYTAFLTAAQALFDRFGPVADPYMTLVGYFNSLRELGGMKRLAEDDVQTRSFRVNMSLVDRPGLSQRRVDDIRELTSRVSSHDIPRYLDQLEIPFNGTLNRKTGEWTENRAAGDPRPIDIVLATNMLSVGVDVNRLGVMVVNGQPKGTAEYIQATSRVGRSPPGLVATVLTWARPRDLSHYETFEHYHATFYQHVEAQSVTPFSPRALDRGLTGTMLSIMRNRYDPFAPNTGAGAMNSPSRPEMTTTIGVLSKRAWEVTEDAAKKALTEQELKHRADDWAKEAGVGGRTLVYQRYGAGPTAYPLLETPGVKPWTDWTVPMSMREVEPGVRLVMEDSRSTNDPTWRTRVDPADRSDA